MEEIIVRRLTLKSKPKKIWAILLIAAMIAGMFPMAATESRAAENKIRNPRVIEDFSIWDCIYFGNYWQEDTNGDGKADKKDDKTPIKWRVLSVNGDDAFLISDKNLDVQRYNNTEEKVSWETCTMRSWLNGYGASDNVCEADYTSDSFINNAFSAEEQSAIMTTKVVNEANPNGVVQGGNDTSDKIYLLSVSEVQNEKYGFLSSDSRTQKRKVTATAYVQDGGEIQSDYIYGIQEYWWLRTPGANYNYASCVESWGQVDTFYKAVDINMCCVRPVLHLNLSGSSTWSYAGTVSANKDISPEMPTQTFNTNTSETATAAPSVSPQPSSIPAYDEKPENPRLNTSEPTEWDYIYFGNYPQSEYTPLKEPENPEDQATYTDEDGTKYYCRTKQETVYDSSVNDYRIKITTKYFKYEEIKWRVLSVDGDDALIMADNALDVQAFDSNKGTLWESSSVRKWLNSTFLERAFTDTEQQAIAKSVIVNRGNSYWKTEDANDTVDKIFLLSEEEALSLVYGFTDTIAAAKSRVAVNTDYAENGGESEWKCSKEWWLRTAGCNSNYAVSVREDGYVSQYGQSYSQKQMIRPVLHLDLSQDVWKTPAQLGKEITITYSNGEYDKTQTAYAGKTTQLFDRTCNIGQRTYCIIFDWNMEGYSDWKTPTAPEGNALVKWNTRADGTGTEYDLGQEVIFTNDVTLYAQNDCTTTYTSLGKPFTLPEGYWFDGWYTEPEGGEKVVTPVTLTDGNMTVYAHWKKLDKEDPVNSPLPETTNDPETITISYEPYDGVFDTARKVESTYGKTYTIASEKPLVYQYMPEYKENPPADGIYNENVVELPGVETPSDEDTAFLNWNTEPDGSGDVLNPGDTIEVYKDIHLYAQYDRTRVETRLWDLSGNFKNYEFLGWYTKPAGGEKITAPYTYDCTKNTVFYAHWQKIDQEPQETASSTITSSPKPSLTPAPSYPEITPTTPPREEPTVTPSIPPTETPLCTITMPPTEEPTVTPTVPPAVVPEAPIVTEEPKAPSDTMAPDVSTISNGVIIEENNEEMEDADERKEETFEKGDYLIVGNLKFKVVKIKGKKGELAFAGVKSKKVSTIVIPSKISKGDISFTITAIAKNAFKGCKKVSEVKIKTVNIKRIQKKALNGLNKKAKIRVPKSVLKAYKKMLKKSKYNVYKW